MKRFVGIVAAVALAGLFAACDSDNNDDKDVIGEVVINEGVTDTKVDTKIDTVQEVPPVDPGQETATEVTPVDPGQETATEVTPVDPGQETATETIVNEVVQEVTTDPGTGECFDDPVGGCKAFYLCANECPTGTAGDACVQECQSALSSAGLAKAQSWETCRANNCGSATTNEELADCIFTKCVDEYFGCFYGCQYATCSNMIDCIVACPNDANRQTCVGNCWESSYPQAQADLQYALNCTYDACPVCEVENPTTAQQTECDNCWNDASNGACATQWEKCVEYGTKKCGEVLDCVNNCADSACAQACFNDGTKTALELWNAMIECANSACPVCDVENPTAAQEEECNTCFNAALNEGGACFDKLQACGNDAAAQ